MKFVIMIWFIIFGFTLEAGAQPEQSAEFERFFVKENGKDSAEIYIVYHENYDFGGGVSCTDA